jgi:Aldehyde dehydrogenase family
MAMIPFDGDEDAIAIADDSIYGLGGSVWTTDEQRGIDVARRVRTGTIGVNYTLLDLGPPFGGMKDSGIGRELGPRPSTATSSTSPTTPAPTSSPTNPTHPARAPIQPPGPAPNSQLRRSSCVTNSLPGVVATHDQ